MKVRLYLDIDSDSELARNIMEAWKRATFPGSAATGFYADGVFYGIAPGGVCVELNQYTHEVPTPYQGMVTSVEITGYIEPTDVITRGTYRRRSSNGSVERFMMGRKTCLALLEATAGKAGSSALGTK